MKRFLFSLVAVAALLSGPALADDRLKPNTSINELSEVAKTAIASGDFIVGYDASAIDWVKFPADSFGTSTAAETVTATNAIATTECGKTFYLNSATEFVSTLPAPTAGCSFEFIVKAAPSGANYTVVTASSANIIIGGINELEVDTADDGPYIADGDTISFVSGGSVVGDFARVRSDGTSWYVAGQANADGGVTLTQAD